MVSFVGFVPSSRRATFSYFSFPFISDIPTTIEIVTAGVHGDNFQHPDEETKGGGGNQSK
jgi:hypothetical protein